jgi:hypothetical protein
MEAEDQVVSIPISKNKEYVKLHSHYTAQQNIADSVLIYTHKIQPAFALTDFKLQGRTLSKLIINICTRLQPPWMNLTAFYVLISRVRKCNDLRVLIIDHTAKTKLTKLKHDTALHAWENGYNTTGDWSNFMAIKALVNIQKKRAKADHDIREHLKAVALAGNIAQSTSTNSEKTKSKENRHPKNRTPPKAPKNTQSSPRKKQRGQMNTPASPDKRMCGICQQRGHLRNKCPLYTKTLMSKK